MLYQVTSTNLRILGSIHKLPPELNNLPPWVWEAFEWSEDLVLEADSTAGARSTLLKYSDGSSLSQHLSPRCIQDLGAAWAMLNIQAPFNIFKPWSALFVMGNLLTLGGPGVETRFTERCVSVGRSISYLETPESLFRTLDSFPAEIQEQAVRTFLDNIYRVPQQFGALCNAWLSRDLAAIEAALAANPMHALSAFRNAIFNERNRAWMPAILSFVTSQRRTLICVGAGHLCGSNNVLSLMRLAGHRISQPT